MNKKAHLLFVWWNNLLLCVLASGQPVIAQDRPTFFIEGAIHFSGDAEMGFIAPAFGVAGGIELQNRWSASLGYTYFGDTYREEDYTETIRLHTFALLVNHQFQNPFNKHKGFYVGLGPAVQFRKQSPPELMTDKSYYWCGAFTLGHRFPVTVRGKVRSLSIDWRAFGPYTERSDQGDYVEVFTQFMIGLRFRY
jgi:hypothetical protein